LIENENTTARPTRVLHEWWERRRGERIMPTRSELDPSELKPILRDLIVIGIEQGGDGDRARFVYRLAGTEIDDRLGIALKGMSLDAAPIGAIRDSIQAQYETVVREGRPVFCSHSMVVNGERYVEYDRLAVPLSDDAGRKTVALLAAVDFRCAYPIEYGRPALCARPHYCDRIDLCLAPRACEATARGG
jgi:hypothetical protein